MKYTTVITSAILSAMACSNAFAKAGHHHLQMPTHHKTQTGLVVGGFIDAQAGYHDQDLEDDHDGSTRNLHFRNNTEIHVHYNQMTDNGLHYGAVVELEADVSAAERNEGLNADKTYLYMQSNVGRVELGNNSDAAHMLGVDASTIAVATGGIHGDYDLYAHFPEAPSGMMDHINLIHSPMLPLSYMHGISEDATKITYYTPNYNGLQLGVSYIPDSGDGGSAAGFSGDNNMMQYENNINTALNYHYTINEKASVTASAAAEFGNAELAAYEDVAAYALGMNLHYGDFSFGGSYSDWGDSTLTTASASDDGGYWTLGAAYHYHNAGFSITYLDSEVDNNELNALSVGTDYQLAPGLTPYLEVTSFDIDPGNAAINGNNGLVTLAGVQINF